MATFAKYCGGISLFIAASKQAEALKDGTVDAIMTGIGNLVSRELWKVSDAITRTEHAPVEFLVFINEKVWQSLSPEHQAIMTAAARSAEQGLRNRMAASEASAYGLARDKGMTVHQLTPDEVADWRACSAAMMEDFMSTSGELGRRLMAAYAKLRTDPCCTAGPQSNFRAAGVAHCSGGLFRAQHRFGRVPRGGREAPDLPHTPKGVPASAPNRGAGDLVRTTATLSLAARSLSD